jgi:hypothetical protein
LSHFNAIHRGQSLRVVAAIRENRGLIRIFSKYLSAECNVVDSCGNAFGERVGMMVRMPLREGPGAIAILRIA